jgi:predicted permease
VSLGTGLLFGLFPALHATRSDLITSIRAGAGQIQGGHRAAARFRSSLVTAQFALSMALLGCAGLFVKSVRNIDRVDLGIRTDEVIQFALLPELSGYAAPRARDLFERAERELAALPGVTAVSASGVPLMTGSNSGGNIRIEGFERGPDTDANTRMNWVGPGFFRGLGIPLVAGREFTVDDRMGAPRVAIVNEAFMRKFGLTGNPVGKRMAADDSSASASLYIEIVGVAKDAGYSGPKREAPPLVYFPWRQESFVTAAAFYVRSSLPPAQAMRSIRATMGRLDPALPLPMLKPLSQQVRETVYIDRMVGTLSAGFAGLATLLAAVGLYGVLAYTVAQRTRELGVRMALGADGRRVRWIVLRQVARMAAIGGVVGLVAAAALGRAAQSMLFGLDGRDPVVLVSAAALLGVVALVAGWVPAWRASRLSPVNALRHD